MTRWIAADWGTSRLRLWAMQGAHVTAQAASDDGMGRLTPEGFEPAFLAAARDMLPDRGPVPVLICGMAGARTGWQEAAYGPVPGPPLQPPEPVRTRDPRLAVRILPGLAQQEPPDVMRGEETQIAGLLAAEPGFDGVLCLPGTHTKWVRIAQGAVLAFRTVMTGELFALIAGQSTLAAFAAEGWDEAAFAGALAEGLADPGRLTSALFAIRAGGLLRGHPPGAARARLSGLLIGAEVAAMRDLWPGLPVTVLGETALSAHYAAALAAAGIAARIADGGALTLAGLITAWAAYSEDFA